MTEAEFRKIQNANSELAKEDKELNRQLSGINERRIIIKNQMKIYCRQMAEYRDQEGIDIMISDHAYKRYFERILGFNMEEVRKKILEDNNIVPIINRNVVLTVITPEMQKRREGEN